MIRPKSAFVVRPAGLTRRTNESFTHDPLKWVKEEDIWWPNDSLLFRSPSRAQLSYASLGRSKSVCLYFHGTPGCRIDAKALYNYLESHNVRVISIDRPGYGRSSLHGRGIIGFMEDVERLLDYWEISEVKVYGVSGGGLCALAAAYHFAKSRLIKTLIMCGTTHPQFEKSSVHMDWRLKKWAMAYAPFLYTPNLTGFIQSDLYEAKDNQRERQYAIAKAHERQRQRNAGYKNDFKLAGRPWGFELEDIDVNPSTIRWYHGLLDTNTSAEAAYATVKLANRYRKNIDHRQVSNVDHSGVQSKKFRASLAWLLEVKDNAIFKNQKLNVCCLDAYQP
jgi:pimeloyl-ACP methyl ester carboxylesterase